MFIKAEIRKIMQGVACAALTLCLNGGIFAQDAGGQLSSLIKTALERNPEITAARRMWQSKAALIAPAGIPPDLNLGVMWENIEPGKYSPAAAGMEMLTLSQKYPFFGKLTLLNRIAESESGIYGYIYRAAELKVISSLKKAYYDAAYYEKAIEIYEEMTEILKHDSRVTEEKYKAGREKQMNVLKAQIELARILDEILTLKNKRYTQQVKINTLLDYPSSRPLEKAVLPEHTEYNLDKEKITREVLLNNPALGASAGRREKAGRALALSKKGYLPDFMVTYKQRRMSEELSGWDFGLSVNLPLYFRKQSGEIKSKAEKVSASENAYDDMKNKIIYSLENTLSQIDTYSRLYNLYKTNFIPQAGQTWKVTETGYKAGQADFIDLLDAERTYLGFRIKFWKYCSEYQKHLAELERLAGKDIKDFLEEK